MTSRRARPTAPGRILCPLDLAERADRSVLDYAAGLAHRLGARLFALHVYALPSAVRPDIVPSTDEENGVRAARRELRRLVEAYPDVEIETEILPGVPHRRILEQIPRLEADLVVMGTHGRGGLSRLVLGSVAERVLRIAPVPVWTLRCGEGGAQPLPSTILAPHDLSACSRGALEVARALRKALHAGVSVVHVLPEELEEDAAAAPWLSREQRRRYRDALSDELAAEVSEVFGPEDQAIPAHIVHGEIVPTLIREVEREQADLVVIGASGKNAVERVLLGSVTLELVRRSPVPVLTVP